MKREKYLAGYIVLVSMGCLYMTLVAHIILITRRLKYTNKLTKCIIANRWNKWWFSLTQCFSLCLIQMLFWYEQCTYLTCLCVLFFLVIYFFHMITFSCIICAGCGHDGCFRVFFGITRTKFQKHVMLTVWSAMEKPTQGVTSLGGYMDEKVSFSAHLFLPRGQMFNPLLWNNGCSC